MVEILHFSIQSETSDVSLLLWRARVLFVLFEIFEYVFGFMRIKNFLIYYIYQRFTLKFIIEFVGKTNNPLYLFCIITNQLHFSKKKKCFNRTRFRIVFHSQWFNKWLYNNKTCLFRLLERITFATARWTTVGFLLLISYAAFSKVLALNETAESIVCSIRRRHNVIRYIE